MIDVVKLLRVLQIDVEFQRGDELWAPCPFHGEKTSSWSIKVQPGSPKHGFFHCFGCHEEGGPVALVASKIGVSYRAAREWIDQRGLNVDDPVSFEVFVEVEDTSARTFVLPVTVMGIGIFDLWPKGAREFGERRGLTAEQVERWSIGFAVDGSLARRIVIPIHDDHGDLWSYTARDWSGKARQKYLTARRADGADHGAVFGALHWPPPEERRRVFVTEGALNALAIERAIGEPVGALDGSALLNGQVLALGTFEEIVIASDPDLAGDLLAGDLLPLSRWRKVRRATLPKGKDANDIERASPEELARLLLGEQADGHRHDVQDRPRGSATTDRRGVGAPSRQSPARRARAGDQPAPDVPLRREGDALGLRRRSEAARAADSTSRCGSARARPKIGTEDP